jgi:hypothetical protein
VETGSRRARDDEGGGKQHKNDGEGDDNGTTERGEQWDNREGRMTASRGMTTGQPGKLKQGAQETLTNQVHNVNLQEHDCPCNSKINS